MRGTQVKRGQFPAMTRFIPAHAGNSTVIRADPGQVPVHPRACGELSLIVEYPTASGGSSPRMRGTPFYRCGAPACMRFIPAHAGNSGPARPSRESAAVHPRACGELASLRSSIASVSGSSPRMRGTRAAGRGIRPITSVHPRACGELESPPCIRQRTDGSSPRMRGTLYYRTPNGPRLRFIPAHAGNSG